MATIRNGITLSWFSWIFLLKISFINFACFTHIGLCWSHTQASKPLGIIEKNTLELPKITIVMQCYDNKNALSGFILNVFILNRLCSYLARFARTFLPLPPPPPQKGSHKNLA
jgi:hypothetical protein